MQGEAKMECSMAGRLLIIATFALGGCLSQKPWHAEEVTGHLPELNFSLISDDGHLVTEKAYAGQIVLLYFGFTRCQVECSVSMARLVNSVELLGDDASHVSILFITLDPEHDSPGALRHYIAQFNSDRAVGLAGESAGIERLSKRYRVAYRPRSGSNDVAEGEITHGDAIYIFDTQGQARLLATSVNTAENLAEDLQRLLLDSRQGSPVAKEGYNNGFSGYERARASDSLSLLAGYSA